MFFSVSEGMTTVNTNNLALEMAGQKLKQVNTIEASDYPWSLKLIDGEIWCRQNDGLSVFNTRLTPLRRMDIGYVFDVALLSRGNVVIAGNNLFEMSKSGAKSIKFNTFNMVRKSL